MSNVKMNGSFDIPLEQIEDMIGAHINGDLSGYNRVVSPRALEEVTEMAFFRKDIVERLIRNIPLCSDSGVFPYANSRVEIFCREPQGLDIGQRFVLERKLLDLMGSFSEGMFQDFSVKGISKMPPVQIYGLDAEGEKAIAFYIPPIVEIHGEHAVLIDGMHRNYLCGSAGTTMNSVHVSYVGNPLPFDVLTWKDARRVREKPPINERYKNLRKEYFRNLGAVGIDG